MNYYLVAVNTPFNRSLLTYSSELDLCAGDLVLVPLGKNRKEKGCVLDKITDVKKLAAELDLDKIKKIDELFVGLPRLDERFLEFLKWVSQYYHYPVGQHIFDVLPKPMKRPQNVELLEGINEPLDYELTSEQASAIETIEKKLDRFHKTLLHGVTGSGKTTVYSETIKKVMKKGRNVLFLVPEINLTPQFLKVLKQNVSGKILSYHSSVTNSEKYKIWNLINDDSEPYIMVGVRSSIFLPYKNLGLIIVDEEHDTSFKQEDRCPYHARDVAIKKAHSEGIPIILGSATPTIESYQQSIAVKDSYIRMAQRPKNISMPEVEIIDGRDRNSRVSEDIWPFTDKGLQRIKEKVAEGEQVLVFVNRLGFASFVQCRSCGEGFDCPNCSVSLKYFKRSESLNCPFCEYKVPLPDSCPSCGNMKLLQKGFGTEKLQDVLQREIPEKKIDRFDRDNIKNFEELKSVLKSFKEGSIDILVGTQMLSKGHNFENVNLVVVLGIDSQLNFPDFRSNEKVFQLLTQVAGRPGRTHKQGQVLVETLSPENKIFERVKNYEWKEFYEEELEVRGILAYPPFTRMCALYFSSRFRERASEAAIWSKNFFEYVKNKKYGDLEILGPRPLSIEKRANKFTWNLLLKTSDINSLHGAVEAFQAHSKFHQSVSVKVDIDPQQLS
ncbi:MAG: primosomal protein N' [Halobacteriovoraceae bacterium]|nr:primosomal protein N' [Halobacteriovoraceae bacterium]|tara:strand:- start:70333 stop:72333 length:2001 start_codon:yes stop_codon:yes gene_type:complete